MLTLIKREIEDHIVYFLVAVIFSAMIVAAEISVVYKIGSNEPPVVSFLVLLFVMIWSTLGYCAMGATQMYTDRTRKISALLSTLPVTRGKILLARIITGILAILTVQVPFVITTIVLLYIFVPSVPIYYGFIFEIFAGVFLLSFACYCIGLQTGWNPSKIIPTLGGLVVTCIFVPLIIIKSVGLAGVFILLLFIAASLICTWHKFRSASL
ncbi:MAG: hypothetical protein ACYS1A_07795 [Planctomycetota bacterium]|jgi:ABC-type transport system involved in multi-copper enzyme maturation permease subunit